MFDPLPRWNKSAARPRLRLVNFRLRGAGITAALTATASDRLSHSDMIVSG
jgi:hypothetical protein